MEAYILNYMSIIWKKIAGFPMYEVSNTGEVRSNTSHGKGKLLSKLLWGSNGYYQVTLGRERHREQIHRLVAMAFIPNPLGKKFVNHIDGNKLNNNVDNLEWVTPSENSKHATRTKLTPLPPRQDKKVRCVETGEVFKSAVVAGKATGANSGHIIQCCRHKPHYKTSGGYHWEYVK